MESELAQAQQAEAEARKGRQAAEANSEQLREESEQLRELREESEQLRGELAKARADWMTVVGSITALGTVAGVMVAANERWQKRPETIAKNAAFKQV